MFALVSKKYGKEEHRNKRNNRSLQVFTKTSNNVWTVRNFSGLVKKEKSVETGKL